MAGAMAADRQGAGAREGFSVRKRDSPLGCKVVRAAAPPNPSMGQVPLSVLRQGEEAVVAKVRGEGDVHHHLESLGFVEGARIRVVSGSAGDLIIEVKGSQVALARQVASRVVARVCA